MSKANKENTNAKPKRRGRPRKAAITTRDPVPHDRDPKPAPSAIPAIHLKRRRCHRCGATEFRVNGSRDNPAGVRVQNCICKACGAKQVFILD